MKDDPEDPRITEENAAGENLAEILSSPAYLEAQKDLGFLARPELRGLRLQLELEKVEKSKKLMKMTVKFGDDVRTIVGGIATVYTAEQLVGRKFAFVYNLARRS